MTIYSNKIDLSLDGSSVSIDQHLANVGKSIDLEVDFSHPLVEDAFQSLKMAVGYLDEKEVAEITEACHFADIAHIKDKRKSGEPYITHPIAVAEIIAGFRLDRDTIISAILHDTVEDTDVTLEEVSTKYGVTVARLVDGVTKLKSSKHNKQQNKAATFYKILLSTLNDPRVLIVKLSDRLHNMSTMGAVRKEKQQETARETLNFYIPFARVMGMNDIADHIEILCYRNLDYDMYTKLSDKLLQHGLGYKLRQDMILSYLQKVLQRKELHGHVKAIDNSVVMYRQFFHNRGDLNQLIRCYKFEVVVDDITACKSLSKYLIDKYNISKNKISDNIHHPLPGGNQSLTLTYHYQYDTIQLVVLTEDMKKTSRLGVIGSENGSEISQSVVQASLRNMKGLLLQNGDSDTLDFDIAENVIEDLLSYLHERKILCYSPLGKVYELPIDSTALDFAYAVGPFVGHIATHAMIDGEEVDLATVVKNGQQVTIVTDEVNAVPKAEWLGFVVTAKARDLITRWLQGLSREEKQNQGKKALSRALQTYDKKLDDLSECDWQNILSWQNIDTKEALYENMTSANPLPQLVVARLFSEEITSQLQDRKGINGRQNLLATLSGVEITFPKCCNPIYGDSIRGYNSKTQGLVVHRHKCHELHEINRRFPERVFYIDWRDNGTLEHHQSGNNVHFFAYLNLHMLITDEQLSLVMSHLRQLNVGIEFVEVLSKTTILHIVVRSRNHLQQGIDELRNLLGFTNIQRMYHADKHK